MQLDTMALLAQALAQSKRDDERRRENNRQDKRERYGQSMDAISKSVGAVGQSLDAYGRIQEQKASREERLANELADRAFRTKADERAQGEYEYKMGEAERRRQLGTAVNEKNWQLAYELDPDFANSAQNKDEDQVYAGKRDARQDAQLADQRKRELDRQAQLDATGVVIAGAPEVPGAKAAIKAEEDRTQTSPLNQTDNYNLVNKVTDALPNALPGPALQAQKMMLGIDDAAAKDAEEQEAKAALIEGMVELGMDPAEAEGKQAMPIRSLTDEYSKRVKASLTEQSTDPMVATGRAGKILDGMINEAFSKHDPLRRDQGIIAAKDKAQALMVGAPDHIDGIMAEFRAGIERAKADREALGAQ